MNVVNIGEAHSVFNQFIAEIRDDVIQKDSMRFRKNLERIGEVFAYEISKKFHYEETAITTPLGIANMPVLKEQPVIATILRAGLPLHLGLLNFMDKAENAFISSYRRYSKDGSFDIQVEYVSSPSLDGKTLILSDPMLATGASLVLGFKALLQRGMPSHTHIVTIIASKEGMDYLQKHLCGNITLWVGAIDDEMTVKSYIVPGLGDAGDLAFGSKI
ncbi:MAG: uracil phosphoribosyltransferase [Bacteroidia bacterium]|nr:uracil phosphoribosyltransferase [Bacteroidia bacterium]